MTTDQGLSTNLENPAAESSRGRVDLEQMAARLLRAALSYERDAREQPQNPEADCWRSQAVGCRQAVEILMGWPAGAAQLPRATQQRRRAA